MAKNNRNMEGLHLWEAKLNIASEENLLVTTRNYSVGDAATKAGKVVVRRRKSGELSRRAVVVNVGYIGTIDA